MNILSPSDTHLKAYQISCPYPMCTTYTPSRATAQLITHSPSIDYWSGNVSTSQMMVSTLARVIANRPFLFSPVYHLIRNTLFQPNNLQHITTEVPQINEYYFVLLPGVFSFDLALLHCITSQGVQQFFGSSDKQ